MSGTLICTFENGDPTPEALVGEAYAAECAAAHATGEAERRKNERRKQEAESVQVFRKRDLKHIQAGIAASTRPVYSVGPPANIGVKGQGKLKADHWKAAIEFELPVLLMKYWHREALDGLSDDSKHRHYLAHSTMQLACAVRQGTSYQTSERHRTKYTSHMHTYLSDILKLKPGLSLVPNHHNALHLGDFLVRFGPVHGWWMFPFERLIGVLQDVNTNCKQGERLALQSYSSPTQLCDRTIREDHVGVVLRSCQHQSIPEARRLPQSSQGLCTYRPVVLRKRSAGHIDDRHTHPGRSDP